LKIAVNLLREFGKKLLNQIERESKITFQRVIFDLRLSFLFDSNDTQIVKKLFVLNRGWVIVSRMRSEIRRIRIINTEAEFCMSRPRNSKSLKKPCYQENHYENNV